MTWGEAISPECGGQFSHGDQGQLSCCSVQQGAGPAISGIVRGGPTCKISMIPCGNLGHEHHHRAQLQQDHEPRYGPQPQLRPRCHHGSTGHPDHYGPGGSRYQVAVQTLSMSIPTWSQVLVQTLDICRTLGGNRSHGHESRSWAVSGPWTQT